MEHIKALIPAIAKEKGFRRSDVRKAEAAALIRQSPPDADELAYMVRELVQCTLPHRNPGNVARWTRTNGNLTLTLVSSVGYPYGSIPRLLLFWMTREALRTGRRLELGSSFYGFLKDLGYNVDNRSGGKRGEYKRVKEQIRRLFATMVSFSRSTEKHETRLNMVVADASDLWWSPHDPRQEDLWGSWVELGEKFYRAITESPVPLDVRALGALKQSPLALDLYAWSTHKVFVAIRRNNTQFVSWEDLHTQFGSDYGRLKNFQQKAKAALRTIVSVHPGLKLSFVRGGVVILPESRLAVPPRPSD